MLKSPALFGNLSSCEEPTFCIDFMPCSALCRPRTGRQAVATLTFASSNWQGAHDGVEGSVFNSRNWANSGMGRWDKIDAYSPDEARGVQMSIVVRPEAVTVESYKQALHGVPVELSRSWLFTSRDILSNTGVSRSLADLANPFSIYFPNATLPYKYILGVAPGTFRRWWCYLEIAF